MLVLDSSFPFGSMVLGLPHCAASRKEPRVTIPMMILSVLVVGGLLATVFAMVRDQQMQRRFQRTDYLMARARPEDLTPDSTYGTTAAQRSPFDPRQSG
jgi:hypothetical protein